MTTTNPPAGQAGSYRVGDLDLNRIGYGAMQLAGILATLLTPDAGRAEVFCSSREAAALSAGVTPETVPGAGRGMRTLPCSRYRQRRCPL